jgi:hypothetical protein
MEAPDTGCAREDCWMTPAKTVWLSLGTKGVRARREAPLGIDLCAGHAADAKVDDFLDGEIWAAILKKFRAEGLPPPTPALTRLEMRDLEEAA